MHHSERKRLEELLASLDANERQRLFKRAAKLRGSSAGKRGKSHKRSRKPRQRVDHDEVDDSRLGDAMRRRGESLHDFVLELLASEEAASFDRVHDMTNRESADRDSATATPSSREGAQVVDSVREGTVLAIGPGTCEVLVEGQRLACVLEASIRKRQRSTIAVGNRATWIEREGPPLVTAIAQRSSELVRMDTHDRRQARVIVANVEVVVVVATLREPPFSPGMLDRFLIAIRRGRATPLVCINKVDLIPPQERDEAEHDLEPLRALEVPVVYCSASTGAGIEELRQALSGRFCAFVGRSGAGKSSLLNRLRGVDMASTGAVRERDGKGRHTTTRAELYEVGAGIRIIDTPGIRTLALGAIDVQELGAQFPDIARYARGCRFRACTHVHEPECAVRSAVFEGRIEHRRWASFLRLIGEDAG